MIVECCDMCGRILRNSYIDSNGKIWEDISYKQKKVKIKKHLWEDTWTDWMTICGKCRKAIAEYEEGK